MCKIAFHVLLLTRDIYPRPATFTRDPRHLPATRDPRRLDTLVSIQRFAAIKKRETECDASRFESTVPVKNISTVYGSVCGSVKHTFGNNMP